VHFLLNDVYLYVPLLENGGRCLPSLFECLEYKRLMLFVRWTQPSIVSVKVPDQKPFNSCKLIVFQRPAMYRAKVYVGEEEQGDLSLL
jgi:hypothetical protein